MTQLLHPTPFPASKQLLCTDRFITSRSTSTELYNNYDTKSEIFSQATSNTHLDKMGNHSQLLDDNNQENAQAQNLTYQTDENQRMYTTLLQN
jgi:hypothetical protein